MHVNMLLSKLHGMPFHIYGTGIVGISIYVALKELHNVTPVSFLVTSLEGNPAQIERVPVEEVTAAFLGNDLILVAVPAEHHRAIGHKLSALSISENRMIYVDSVLENQIMEAYYASLPAFETVGEYLEKGKKPDPAKLAGKAAYEGGNLRLPKKKAGGALPDIKVYQAKCHVDRPLMNEAAVAAYIWPIQVGAALTEQFVADQKDNTGDNISKKNRDYCELTATYHIWKNSTAAYKGLCHYRRVFSLDDVEIEQLLGAADVILPYPTIHIPDIMNQHSRYVSEAEWQAMRQAVTECEPAYAADFDRIFSDRYFYNFNMLVARAKVFDDYARWMFRILGRTEKIIAAEGIIPAKRYAGYLGENLTTFYFRKNRDKLRIVHTGKVHLI